MNPNRLPLPLPFLLCPLLFLVFVPLLPNIVLCPLPYVLVPLPSSSSLYSSLPLSSSLSSSVPLSSSLSSSLCLPVLSVYDK